MGKTAFRCHRTLLSARSPVFRQLFDQGGDQGVLRINATSPTTFARLLQYIYSFRLTKYVATNVHVQYILPYIKICIYLYIYDVCRLVLVHAYINSYGQKKCSTQPP